jgi:large subunit ribosomal protein L21
MYAVIKTGGKEYKVSQGDIIQVEKIDGKVGDLVTLKNVLMVCSGEKIDIGKPYLENTVIIGEIVRHAKGNKILTYKMKKRKNYRRLKGHRQNYTYLKINEISLGEPLNQSLN